jgi:hypothetical protein
MTESKITTAPRTEFREIARRFLWLLLLLAVIWAVVAVAHEPVSELLNTVSHDAIRATAKRPA